MKTSKRYSIGYLASKGRYKPYKFYHQSPSKAWDVKVAIWDRLNECYIEVTIHRERHKPITIEQQIVLVKQKMQILESEEHSYIARIKAYTGST